jgi:hypothetical protein
MFIRSFLVVMVIGLFATPAFSQFGQSNRLMDMAARLTREAENLADANYSSYTNSSRNNRNEIEAVMLTQQFAGASRIFYRMTVDRRRNQDLRDAFDVLSRLARTVEQNNLQQSSWYNIRQLLSDIAREVSSNQNPGPFPPGTGDRSGRMTWRGRVDDDVRIRIRGGSADVETLGGTPYNDSQPNFENSLPNRRVTVRLTSKRGRGEVSSSNSHRARTISPRLSASGIHAAVQDNYEFTLEW